MGWALVAVIVVVVLALAGTLLVKRLHGGNIPRM
jgi:hypothetical protein